MMCNLFKDFLQTLEVRQYSTRFAKIIDRKWVWLECDFFKSLTIFFIFGMQTHFLAECFLWLEMLSTIYSIHKSCLKASLLVVNIHKSITMCTQILFESFTLGRKYTQIYKTAVSNEEEGATISVDLISN